MLLSILTQEESDALDSVSASLGVNPDWLYKEIDFESGWDPAATNKYSGARGLIQFTHPTARGMGYASADAIVQKYPDRASQLLGPVFQYLKPYSPFPTQQSLAMAVFYPVYRNVRADTLFPDSVQAVNPGIKTPQNYIDKVFGIGWLPAVAIVGLLAVGLFIFSQRGN